MKKTNVMSLFGEKDRLPVDVVLRQDFDGIVYALLVGLAAEPPNGDVVAFTWEGGQSEVKKTSARVWVNLRGSSALSKTRAPIAREKMTLVLRAAGYEPRFIARQTPEHRAQLELQRSAYWKGVRSDHAETPEEGKV